jgi:hypothetical protein
MKRAFLASNVSVIHLLSSFQRNSLHQEANQEDCSDDDDVKCGISGVDGNDADDDDDWESQEMSMKQQPALLQNEQPHKHSHIEKDYVDSSRGFNNQVEATNCDLMVKLTVK